MKSEYMTQPWFALLRERCETSGQSAVARRLGLSPAAVCQVVKGTGKYGTGLVSTARIAERVIHTFGRYSCPHLTEQAEVGQVVVVTAEECRAYAHRPAPSASPRELQHWQACLRCPHKAASAPPAPRPIRPRKKEGSLHVTSL